MKKKLERPTLIDFRNYYKIAVIKILGKTNRNGTEDQVQN